MPDPTPTGTPEAETDDLYLKAARAYCFSRFDYNDAVYVDGERGRRKHLENDALATVDDSPWLKAVVDAVGSEVSRLRTRVAELEAASVEGARYEEESDKARERLVAACGCGDGNGTVMYALRGWNAELEAAHKEEIRWRDETMAELEDQAEKLIGERSTALDRAEAAEAAVARVRALHSPRGVNALCPECQDPTPAPCPTLRALDGVPAFPAVGQDGKLGNLPTVDSDTLALAEMTCPECGATIRARMAYPDGTDREKAAPNA